MHISYTYFFFSTYNGITNKLKENGYMGVHYTKYIT